MDFTSLLNRSRKLIRKRFHNGRWSSKCECFYDIYEAIIEGAYPIKTVLNIGVGPNLEARSWNGFLKKIYPSIETFENLEISPKNFKKASESDDELVNNVTLGDVRAVDEYFRGRAFDMVFWNQGPEHIYRPEWEETFAKLASITSKVIYIHTPWGSGYDDDKWHFAKSIRRGEFERYGFICGYHGKEDTRDAGVMGYRLV